MPSLGRVLERLTVAVDADTSEVDRKLHGLSDESKGGSWVGKLGGASSKAGAMMAVGIGGGIAAMAGFGLAAASQAEQSKIAFTSIMGDAGRAEAFLGDLSSFAARTPFELPGLKDAASRLLAVGTESSRVIPIMTALGDSTSAMGTGAEGIDRAVTALTQMQTKGKVTGEEMLQLAEAGVPAWDALATVMGVSVADAQKKVSAGQVEANTLFTALETKAGPAMQRVAGMMDKQSASAVGMLSTLKDTATQGLGQMMGPALQEIKRMMPEITTLMTSTFKDIGPQIAGLVPPILNLFKSLMGLVPGIVKGIGQILPVVSRVVTVFASLLEKIPPGVIFGIVGAFLAFGPIAGIISGIASAIPVLGAVFAVLTGPVGIILALAAGAFLLYKNWDRLPQLFDTVKDRIGDAVGWMADKFKEFAPKVVAALKEWAPKVAEWFTGTALPAVGGFLLDGVKFMADKFTEFAPKVLDALVEWIPKIANWWWTVAWPAVWGFIWDGLKQLAGVFVNLAGWAVEALVDYAPKLLAWWNETAWPAMWDMVWNGMKTIAAINGYVSGWVVEALVDYVPKWTDWWLTVAYPAMWDAVWNGMKTIAAINGYVSEWAIEALTDFVPKMHQWWWETAYIAIYNQLNAGWKAIGDIAAMLPAWTIIALFEWNPKMYQWFFDRFKDIQGWTTDGLVKIAAIWGTLPTLVIAALFGWNEKSKQSGEDATRSVGDGIESQAGGVVSRMRNFVIEPLKSIFTGGLLREQGVDLVIGLWNGISSMGSWIATRVRSFVEESVLNVVNAVARIGSPSKVTMDQGRWIGVGLANGIAGTAGLVSAAASKMGTAAIPSLGAAASPSLASPATGASGFGGVGVSAPQVIQVNNEVYTPEQLFKRFRVMIVDDGGRNAFPAAAG